LKINVENAPFLVTKLKVQVLPCVIAFKDGISVDRIIGFEGLGRTPNTFTTRDLEARLLRADVLVRLKFADDTGSAFASRSTGKPNRSVADEDEDDWD
jgi:hypothetical protein